MRILGRIAMFALSCVLAAGIAQAQRLDGELRVTVSDKSGATVEDARVTVTNDATNVGITANASSAGTYVFPNLLVGMYTISVEKVEAGPCSLACGWFGKRPGRITTSGPENSD